VVFDQNRVLLIPFAETIQTSHGQHQGLAAFDCHELTGKVASMRVSEDWTDASHQIIVDKDNGKLLFDKDGTEGTAEVYFATTGTNLAVTSADFFVFCLVCAAGDCQVATAPRTSDAKEGWTPVPSAPPNAFPPSTDRSRFFDGVCCNGFGDRL
jgi:hypothetical protein